MYVYKVNQRTAVDKQSENTVARTSTHRLRKDKRHENWAILHVSYNSKGKGGCEV